MQYSETFNSFLFSFLSCNLTENEGACVCKLHSYWNTLWRNDVLAEWLNSCFEFWWLKWIIVEWKHIYVTFATNENIWQNAPFAKVIYEEVTPIAIFSLGSQKERSTAIELQFQYKISSKLILRFNFVWKLQQSSVDFCDIQLCRSIMHYR